MSVDGVSGIASGFGSSITVKRLTPNTSGELDLNRTRYGTGGGRLSATQRRGMVSWLTESRQLHAKLNDAIKLAKGSTFGLREKETGGTVETGDLGLSTAEAAATMDSVGLFSGVSNGTLTVGGEDITIDTSVMSFDDLVDAIGDTDAARASFDGDTLKVVAETGDLTITSDDTGTLSALGLTTGTTEATTFKTGRRSNDSLIGLIEEIADMSSSLFRRKDGDIGTGSPLAALRGKMKTAMLTSFGSDDTDNDGDARSNDMGFRIDMTNLTDDNVAPQAAFQFLESDSNDLRNALIEKPSEVRTYLLGEEGQNGLLDGLRDAIKAAHSAVESQIGLVGGLLSTTA
jgi:hypothetical protein